MKKALGLCILLLLVFSLSSLSRKFQGVDTSNFKRLSNTQVKEMEKAKEELKEVASVVPTVDSFKEDFEKRHDFKDEAQVSALIDEKDQKLVSLNLINKANVGKLTAEESTQLVTLIRSKIALNQILLDMKMKKFEGRFL